MFRVIPVPVLINDTFIAVKTPTKFLVVNLHRDQYYLISDTEATACAHNQGNEHICKQQHPIYSKNADLVQCEANFLNNLPLSPACEISKTTNTQDWIQLFKPNQWIFVMTKEVTITIVCQTTVAQRTIKGSGILKLGDNCIIKHETMTINSHNVYPSHLRTSFLPSLNISDHINISHPTHLSYQPRPHKLNLSDLEEIQERIQQLKEYQITEPSLPAHDVHQFFIGYFGLFLVITIGSCLWWRTRRPSPKSTRHEPTPAPRNLTSKDFTFGEVSTH